MSAWIVSKQHINTMVYFAIENDLLGGRTPDEFGQMLWQENHTSVNHRYNGRHGYDGIAPEYIYTEPVKKPTDSAHMVNFECYDYQTCEHQAYGNSDSFKFVDDALSILRARGAESPPVNYNIPEDQREIVWGWDFD